MQRRAVLASTASLAGLAGCLFQRESGGHEARDLDGDLDGYESGDLEIVIDGEPVDLNADRFQAEHAENYSIDFHFHEGDDQWYMDRDRVTFAEGIELLPYFEYERVEGADIVTYDGTVYDGGDDDTAFRFEHNGDVVDPTTTELHDGDDLLLEISTNE